MSNFNPLSKPKAHLNRNGFDLSQRHTFSQRIGELLPIMCIDTVPGDHYEINVGNLVKTQPVKTDAFARIRQNLEFYFVPYAVLWRHWHQFVLQRDIPESVQDKMASFTPCFDLNKFLNQVSDSLHGHILNSFSSNVGVDALRLCDMLGYGAYYERFLDSAVGPQGKFYIPFQTEKFVNVFRIAAYQKIWYDFYRNKYYDTSSYYAYLWNFDDLGGTISTPSSSISDYDVSAHDRMLCSDDGDFSVGLFTIRYRQWKKDLFTSAMPTAQFGSVSTVGLTDVNIRNNANPASNTNAVVLGGSGSNKGHLSVNDGTVNSTEWNIPNAFSVYDLKRAEYLQHWKESVLRAGQSIESQYKARFGTHSQVHDDHVSQFLGSYYSDLDINPVYNTTADSGNNNSVPLGEIGGRAQVLGNGHLKFDAQDYGVLMCISSFVPETEYNAGMIDKLTTLTQPFDFFTPEFDNIGLEPVYAFQMNSNGARPEDIDGIYVSDSEMNHVIGYSSPWSMYKTAVDKCHDAFMSRGNTLKSVMQQLGGVFSNWVIPRYFDNIWQIKDYYIDPYVDQSIFYLTNFKETDPDSTDNYPIDMYLTSCHYLCDVYFDVKAVRPMSTLGLPQW